MDIGAIVGPVLDSVQWFQLVLYLKENTSVSLNRVWLAREATPGLLLLGCFKMLHSSFRKSYDKVELEMTRVYLLVIQRPDSKR